MRYQYHTEPPYFAMMIAAVLIIVAIVLDDTLIRVILFAVAVGPITWALLQFIRRHESLHIGEESLSIERQLSGSKKQIPYSTIQGYTITSRGGLALACLDMPKDLSSLREVGLTEIEPREPKQRLLITAPIENISGLITQLDSLTQPKMSEKEVTGLVLRRRVRNLLLLVLFLLGTPLYVIILQRVFRVF